MGQDVLLLSPKPRKCELFLSRFKSKKPEFTPKNKNWVLTIKTGVLPTPWNKSILIMSPLFCRPYSVTIIVSPILLSH